MKRIPLLNCRTFGVTKYLYQMNSIRHIHSRFMDTQTNYPTFPKEHNQQSQKENLNKNNETTFKLNSVVFLMNYNNIRGKNWRLYSSLRNNLIKFGGLTGVFLFLCLFFFLFCFLFCEISENVLQNRN